MAALTKYARIVGREREALTAKVIKQYANGVSIRALANEYGRSYGFIHRVLSDGEVKLRGRGGSARKVTPRRSR